jgi:glycosyltransferase involved in cell wall biosynthesis
MSQAVPIVATAVGDVGSVNPHGRCDGNLLRHGETGLLVPPSDPIALAAALRATLREPGAARQRAARAAEGYARRYTRTQMVERYERVYTDCLHQRRDSFAVGHPRKRVAEASFYSQRVRPSRRTRLLNGRRPAVLMVGPAAPQVGGMVSAIDGLMRSRLQERYELHRFVTMARRWNTRASTPPDALRNSARLPLSGARHVVALARLAAVVLERRIALAHIHTCSRVTFYRNLLDLLVVKLFRCRAVLHIRGGQFERFCAESDAWKRWLIRRGAERADAVIVLSEAWKTRLSPFLGRARLVVIPNGVVVPAPARRAVVEPDRPCRFLFLGPLTEAKGLGDLIEAARLLQRDGTPFELVIAGPARGVDASAWRQRIERAGLGACARLVGPVTGRAKAELLASVDCLVHPSHSEGMPFAVLEAAACGLPVVATAVGSVPELMSVSLAGPHDGESPHPTLVRPRDPEALAREMARWAGNPDRRRAFGEVLRAHIVAKYSLEQTIERIDELYAGLLPRRFQHDAVSARWAGTSAGQAAPGRRAVAPPSDREIDLVAANAGP